MNAALELQMAGRRILSTVLGVLSVLGLAMATVGLFGLVAESVVERSREFAVRLAIGASPRRIVAEVLRQALRLTVSGFAVGCLLAAALSGALRSELFGVTMLEPGIYLTAGAVLGVIVILASLLPAWRASRVNPMAALRSE
jgi:ABC-type antimicrobial peptide transport system permease subunit